MSRRYKKYLKNPELDIPKATAWRHKRALPILPSSTKETSKSPSAKKRKLYHRTPTSVPRQTLHYWKLEEGQSQETNVSSEESDSDIGASLYPLENDLQASHDSNSEVYSNTRENEENDCERDDSDQDLREENEENDDERDDSDQDYLERESYRRYDLEKSSVSDDHNSDGQESGDSQNEDKPMNDDYHSDTEGHSITSGCEDSKLDESDCDTDLDNATESEKSDEGTGMGQISEESDNEESTETSHEAEQNGSQLSSDLLEQQRVQLYPGAPLSEQASWLSIFQLSVSNNLTDQATQQILDLMQIHLPESNSCPRTLHMLKKKLGFSSSANLQYCSICMKEVSKDHKKCTEQDCRRKNSQLCYFSVLPFEEHLKSVFTKNWDAVHYPFTRKSAPSTLKDIQDGSEYKKLMGSEGFLSIPEHTGLVLCCDGVPLFKSSGQSLWPIILCITNLPPEVRMKAEYLLLGGVWLGPVKPRMEVILKPVIDKINAIDIPLEGKQNLRAKLLAAVFDLPAKAMALNCIQFNGNFGCPYCLDQGITTCHRRLFLPSDSHTPRTTECMNRWAEEAEETGEVIFGVKGRSVLSPHIDLLKAVPIDYMHAVLEGVVKSLFNAWFDSKNSRMKFYLGMKKKDIDRALLRIKPPHEFRRTPRSISTSKYWKASEYRAWLLCYSIPVLLSFLHKDYLFHLSLLVTSMHILLSTSISQLDLECAQTMLYRFHELIPELYPQTMCTMNAHSLIHLCDFVQQWGPLWCYSAFGFESFNGFLKKHCHGTRNVLPQLIKAVQLRQLLPLQQKEIATNENMATVAFLEKFGKGVANKKEDEPLGRVKNRKLSEEELQAINAAGFQISEDRTVPVFPRYRKNGVVFKSKTTNLRNSSVCMINLEGSKTFASIRRFCIIDGCPIIIASLFDSTVESVLEISPNRSVLLPNDIELAKCIKLFIHKVKKLSLTKKTTAITPEKVIEKCVHVPVKHSPIDYVITQPNTFEFH